MEQNRYGLRETISAELKPCFEQRDFATVSELLDQSRVLRSPYLDMAEVAARARFEGSLAQEIDQPGIGPMLATGSPVRWDGVGSSPELAPQLGADTGAVLADVLGLSDAELGRLSAIGAIGALG